MKKVVHTSGKRKTAIARGTVREGKGRIRVNKSPIELYDPELARLKLTEPLELASPRQLENNQAFDGRGMTT